MGDIPPQLATYYSFNVPIEINDEVRIQHINLINGAAVERMQGPPRPTTISVTQEWLNQLEPIEQGERRRVLYLTGNPHILRTAADTSQFAIQAGHDEIDWEIAGTDHNPGKAIQTSLGEIARLIDNDVRKNYLQSEESLAT